MKTLSKFLGFERSREFYSLPRRIRAEVSILSRAFERVSKSPVRIAALRRESGRLPFLSGSSVKSLERKYYRWLRSGRDWRSLVNRAKAPPRHSK